MQIDVKIFCGVCKEENKDDDAEVFLYEHLHQGKKTEMVVCSDCHGKVRVELLRTMPNCNPMMN